MNTPQLILKESNPNISKDLDSCNPNEQLAELAAKETQEIQVKTEQEVEDDEDQEVLDEQLHNLNNKSLNFNINGNKQQTALYPFASNMNYMIPAYDKEMLLQESLKSGGKIANLYDHQINPNLIYGDFLNRQTSINSQSNKTNEIQEEKQNTQEEESQNSEGVLRDYLKKISTQSIFSVVDINIEASARWSLYLYNQSLQHQNYLSMLLNKQFNPFNQFNNQMSQHNPMEEEFNLKKKNKISIDSNQNQKQSQTTVNEETDQNLQVEARENLENQGDQYKNNEQDNENQSLVDQQDQIEESKKEETIINQKEGEDDKDQEKSTTQKIINMDLEEQKQNQQYPQVQIQEFLQKKVSNQQDQTENEKENDQTSINKIVHQQSYQIQKKDDQNKENQKDSQTKKNRKQSQSSSQGIQEIGNLEYDKSLSKKSSKKSKAQDKEQDKLQRLSRDNSIENYIKMQEYMNLQNMNNAHQQALMLAPLFGNQNPYLPPNSSMPPYLDAPLHQNSLEFSSQFNPYIPQLPEVSTLNSQQNNNNWNNIYSLGQRTVPSHPQGAGITQLPQFPGQLQNPLFLQALNQQILSNQARDCN